MTETETAPDKARVLVVEDEKPMRTVLADCLEDEGYRVLTAEDGEAGLAIALRESPDLIVLDIMMPKLDGYAVCRELRRLEKKMPVLMLTAKGQTEDIVTGLDAGADDYLVKPFSRAELYARVRALLRRAAGRAALPDGIVLGKVRILFKERRVVQSDARGKDTELPMTPKEFAMLELLARHAGEAVSRDQFLDVVWGYASFPTTRTVDNHIAGLRAKIETDPAAPEWIETVHGTGYRLALPEK